MGVVNGCAREGYRDGRTSTQCIMLCGGVSEGGEGGVDDGLLDCGCRVTDDEEKRK